MGEENKIVIEFTEELLEEWTKEYFKSHPRARKRPIEKPGQPSLNDWIILRRIAMNSLKQNYKDYTKFVVQHYGLEDLSISKCECKYITYRSTKRRMDLDNTSPKFILDGLTAECTGVIVDDSSDCITKLILEEEYHKGINGARIEFYNCEFDKEAMLEAREKEIAKSNKRKATMKSKGTKKKSKSKK